MWNCPPLVMTSEMRDEWMTEHVCVCVFVYVCVWGYWGCVLRTWQVIHTEVKYCNSSHRGSSFVLENTYMCVYKTACQCVSVSLSFGDFDNDSIHMQV